MVPGHTGNMSRLKGVNKNAPENLDSSLRIRGWNNEGIENRRGGQNKDSPGLRLGAPRSHRRRVRKNELLGKIMAEGGVSDVRRVFGHRKR